MYEATLDEFLSREISLEELRSRYARLKRLVWILVAALAISGLLLLAGFAEGQTSMTGDTPAAIKTAHGTYCTWEGEPLRYFSTQLAKTPSFRDFQRFCERSGGALGWRP